MRSSIGRCWRSSATRNAAIRSAEATSSETILVEPHPASLPCSSAYTSRNSDPENVTRPSQSTPVALGSRDSVDAREREHDGGDADRDVDEEDPLPADAGRDDPADDRPDGDGGAGDGPEDPEGDPAVAALEGLGDQRERGGEHHRPADPLHGAGEVEHQRGVGEPADGGGAGEHHEAGREHQPAPEQVGERSGRQQEGGERQRVGVDDPLQVGEGGVQFALDRGQRDVHDGDVEQQHEDRDRHRDQGPPLALHRFGPPYSRVGLPAPHNVGPAGAATVVACRRGGPNAAATATARMSSPDTHRTHPTLILAVLLLAGAGVRDAELLGDPGAADDAARAAHERDGDRVAADRLPALRLGGAPRSSVVSATCTARSACCCGRS